MGGIVGHWGSYGLKQVNPFQFFKITNNYLLYIFSHHFQVNFLIISRSTELISDLFKVFGILVEVLWGKAPSIEAATAWNREIPFKYLTIPHNYLIFLCYHQFLNNFLIISRSTDSIFDAFKIFWSKRWSSLWKIVGRWSSYGVKAGKYIQDLKIYPWLPNIYILSSFFFTFSSFQGPQSL